MGAPIKHTCPDIDKVIKRLNELRVNVNDTIKKIESSLDDMLNEIDGELSHVEDSLEELRSDNSALRDWGYQSEGKVNELEERVSDLKWELDNVKDE